MNVNFWVGCGRLTRDAEASVTKKGTSMSKFRLAVNDRRNDDTLFLNVLCFGKMAESLNEHLTKGRLVSVTGKVKVDEYEDKNGAMRSSVCIMADDISLGPNAGSGRSSSSSTEEAPF
jgi:single-strand DNA-binding protein|tara:strand:+ start:799 stop:1152 length:354 start_codon:yes stop_codon:yes gene_type:complete